MQLTKRRLTDLWVVGRQLTLDDGDGEPVTVWLQKLNGTEMAETTRRCDAQRARVMAGQHDPADDEWQSVMVTVKDYARGDVEKLVDFLLLDERNKLNRVYESQVANEEEWSKEGYVQGLHDIWNQEMQRRWLVDHDDEEAARCKDELDRFTAQVNEQTEAEIDVLRDAWSQQPVGELEERMATKLLEMDAGQAWMNELWACQIYYGVREPEDKKQLYFVTREEVNTLAPRTFEALHQAYADLEVDVAEGKGLPAPTSSSPSSEEPGAVATEPSSGPVGASR